MLIPIERLIDTPVMSLQTGGELARIREPIIDPRQMTIVAFYVDGRLIDTHPSILHVADIREYGEIGMIIDDSDKLMGKEGLVRLQQIIDFGFQLDGIRVIDEHNRKLGKVSDYAIEPQGYTVQQLYTEQSFIKSLSNVSSVIHRSQIVSVSNEHIVVQSPTLAEKATEQDTLRASFVNPFRAKPQQETIDQD